MNNEELKDLFLNWKGLELIHVTKTIFKWLIIILSIIFIYLSARIHNDFVLGASLILLFLQILSENNKEYYLKYKEIFKKAKNRRGKQDYKEWTIFLEKTKGLNSLEKWFFGLFYKKTLKKLKEYKI